MSSSSAPYASQRFPLTTAFSTDSAHAVELATRRPDPSVPREPGWPGSWPQGPRHHAYRASADEAETDRHPNRGVVVGEEERTEPGAQSEQASETDRTRGARPATSQRRFATAPNLAGYRERNSSDSRRSSTMTATPARAGREPHRSRQRMLLPGWRALPPPRPPPGSRPSVSATAAALGSSAARSMCQMIPSPAEDRHTPPPARDDDETRVE